MLLAEGLSNIKSITIKFEDLAKDVTPLYFCINCVEARNKIQTFLTENNIYAPIIWPRSAFLGNEVAHNAYQKLLCIPCDQRYNEKDMARIIETFNRINNE